VGKEGWHPGVVGIVAGRLAETYHRPTVVVALNDGQGQGPARSIAGFNVHDAIKACSAGLTGFGGHAAAAGLRLPAANLPAFALALDQHCRLSLTAEQKERMIWIDAEVPLGMLSVKLVEELDQLEPYGLGNPKPILAASGVRILGEPKVVGERKNHVQLRFRHENAVVKAIAWNAAERFKSLAPDTLCSVAFHPSINEWNNRRDVQLEIRDIQVEPVA
jgi:single-stranded-DNA-specific exonuclease